MSMTIRRVEYFHATVKDQPGEAYKLLSRLATDEVSLLAFNAVPVGPEQTQLVIFPESVASLARTAEKTGIILTGPQRAFLIQGDDQLGALVELHRKLADAKVNVYASSGVTDGRGGYGYVLYVRSEHFEDAASALGV
jgi:hypothetical protein